jgi:DNA-binding XRE family transcriptional regulator
MLHWQFHTHFFDLVLYFDNRFEYNRKLGITQMDLALLINLSFNAYFKVEKGTTKLDTERLFIILEVLISPSSFLKI